VWGSVVNLSRNFARQSLLWLPPQQAAVAVRRKQKRPAHWARHAASSSSLTPADLAPPAVLPRSFRGRCAG
jgi:hypothetical protein